MGRLKVHSACVQVPTEREGIFDSVACPRQSPWACRSASAMASSLWSLIGLAKSMEGELRIVMLSDSTTLPGSTRANASWKLWDPCNASWKPRRSSFFCSEEPLCSERVPTKSQPAYMELPLPGQPHRQTVAPSTSPSVLRQCPGIYSQFLSHKALW